MRFLTLISFVLLINYHSSGQGRYMTKTGTVTFFSEAPLEDIDAINKKVQSVIDLDGNGVAISMDIESFMFDKKLMQEHFNENYMESDQYPKATFSGTFSPDNPLDRDGAYDVIVEGDLTIHGVKKPLKTTGIITLNGDEVQAQTTFEIKLEDFDIDIPKLVFKKIAEIVEVKVDLNYTPLN